MNHAAPESLFLPLFRRQLSWLIGMRWVAGGSIVGFDAAQAVAGFAIKPFGMIAGVGAGLLVFNAALRSVVRTIAEEERSRGWMIRVAWAQVFVDLLALSTLVGMTGSLSSPLLGFFVFHMIIMSVFLPRAHAFGAAGLAIVMMLIALRLTGSWPRTAHDWLIALGWTGMLVLTVYMVGTIMLALHRRERTLHEQRGEMEQIADRQLAQELQMLQLEKLVSIGQLAAGVAHEISNPLAGMDGLLQLMERSPEKVRPAAVAQLREQVARINETMRQMTALGRPDLGEPQPINCNDVVRETLHVLRYDHRLRSIELLTALSDDPGIVMAPPRAIQQALMNLLINAADAVTGRDEPRIEVRTERDDRSCRILIRDNGPGIDPGDSQRIFQPFVTTKPIGRGTGLGLPISRDLVQAQRGTLTFESEPGAGATFIIALPLRDAGAVRA
ncbi:MAG: hypothetical protein H6813_06850 [Phycisphaeraceae bacterium]|nr:hypothetical protein [Phycisphaeraceae bacterium]MCB9848653.1 hypothetical protein [Phycisphaeraceae bacterium]